MTPRIRFWAEAGTAALSGFLCVLTLVWRDWLEAIVRVSPDNHDGSVEWLIVAALLAVAAAAGVAARSEWRRHALRA
ncbi:MAG TPA: hypothetical protein VF101_09870 [Gaiellaceae bacterium]